MNLLKKGKQLKVCLIGATFSTSNMGVAALTAGTIKTILHIYPEAKINLLDYGKKSEMFPFKSNGENYLIQLINMRFSKKIFLRNNIAVLILYSLILKLVPSKIIRENIISKNIHLNAIYKSDICASIAAGDSFSDIYGMKRFFYVSLPQLLVLLLRKKLILLPQTIGPFSSVVAKLIAKYIMNRADLIYTREYKGLEELEEFLGTKVSSEKVKFCYDVGFVIDPISPNKIIGINRNLRKSKSTIVGLNISGLLFMGGYTRKNMFGLKFDYENFIYELINYLVIKKDFTVMLVPHVFGSSESSESDSVVCSKIYESLKGKNYDDLLFPSGDYNQNEIKYIIGLCDFFVGSRMHSCIAALSQNIPAVAIAYSKKFLGVYQSIGLESLVADPKELCEEEIMIKITEAYNNRIYLRNHLENKMPHVKQTILTLFDSVKSES